MHREKNNIQHNVFKFFCKDDCSFYICRSLKSDTIRQQQPSSCLVSPFFETCFSLATSTDIDSTSTHNPICLYLTASWQDSLLHPELSCLTTRLINSTKNIDVLSLNLPFHPVGVDYNSSFQEWKKSAEKGEAVLVPFAKKVCDCLEQMHQENRIDLKAGLILAGLSRGALAATHIAYELQSRMKSTTTLSLLPSSSSSFWTPYLCLFAPVTTLLPDERHKEDIESAFSLLFSEKAALLPPLLSPLFLSIGSCDTKVVTSTALLFFEKYIQAQQQSRGSASHPYIDATLSIHPSIGFMGHGTPSTIFELASTWIGNKI